MRQLLVMELGVAPNCLDAALFSNQRLFHNGLSRLSRSMLEEKWTKDSEAREFISHPVCCLFRGDIVTVNLNSLYNKIKPRLKINPLPG